MEIENNGMVFSPDDVLQERYLIVRLIARGGMGAVYEAVDQRLGNTVALKHIMVNNPELRESFEQEARLLANLQHPVLPVVSDHFSEANEEFLVMQYIPGEDLGELLASDKEIFAPADVLRWADQLLDALDYLHSQKPVIIHRDIKPRNLKLNQREDIMLLDFGMAKSLQMLYKSDSTGGRNIRVFTPEYAPLEQIQGTSADPRSDLYALAATLYHLLTGTPPPDTLTRVAAILSEQTDPLRPANELNPQVPPAVAVILHQAMSHSMEQRFASAAAMRSALRMIHKPGVSITSADIPLSSSGQTTVPIVQQKQVDPQEPAVATPAPSDRSVVIVSRHQDGHYQTIAEAVANARPGTRILVRPGIYREGIIIDRPLEIIGDGPVEDIFIESTDSTCILMQTDYALIRGLTLRGRTALEHKKYVTVDIPQGRLLLEECDISSDSLASVAIHGNKANPVIWRCQIHDGKSAGILVYDHGQGLIEDCDIFSNSGPGVEIRNIGNPIIRRCKIHHGERDGVHITDKGAGMVLGCDIFGNARAGVSIRRDSNPFVRLCQIHEQLNGYGVYVYDKGEGTIEGCNIFGNAKAGVGITQGGNPFFRRCRIHHEKQRGVFVFENGEGTIERCYILSNSDTGVSIGQGSSPTIYRCQINQNGSYAIRVLPNGSGRVENCDLTNNAQGAWDIAARCTIYRNENRE
jgi:serine/threonine protein kinase/nitrous oxidase accessory protein NosD